MYATKRILAAWFFVMSTTAISGQQTDALSLSFWDGEVTIDGATPHSAVALSYVARVPLDGISEVYTDSLSLPTDTTGSASFRPEEGLPIRSLWVAVDVASGRHAAAWPGDGVPPVVDPFPGDLRPGVGNVDRFESPALHLQLTVVRPGSQGGPRGGAWGLRGRRGGPNDSAPPNRGTGIYRVDAMRPLFSGDDVIPALRPHDIVVAINPNRMTYFVTQVVNTGK
jgi:hypothetical protein